LGTDGPFDDGGPAVQVKMRPSGFSPDECVPLGGRTGETADVDGHSKDKDGCAAEPARQAHRAGCEPARRALVRLVWYSTRIDCSDNLRSGHDAHIVDGPNRSIAADLHSDSRREPARSRHVGLAARLGVWEAGFESQESTLEQLPTDLRGNNGQR